VFLQRAKFGFCNDHAKVVALEVVIGDMIHAWVVAASPEISQTPSRTAPLRPGRRTRPGVGDEPAMAADMST
jgi:hypothetical protein